MAFHCAAGDDRNPVQKREMSATLRDRSSPRELIKRSGVDAVVLGEGAEAVQAKPPPLNYLHQTRPLAPSIFSRAKTSN